MVTTPGLLRVDKEAGLAQILLLLCRVFKLQQVAEVQAPFCAHAAASDRSGVRPFGLCKL